MWRALILFADVSGQLDLRQENFSYLFLVLLMAFQVIAFSASVNFSEAGILACKQLSFAGQSLPEIFRKCYQLPVIGAATESGALIVAWVAFIGSIQSTLRPVGVYLVDAKRHISHEAFGTWCG